MVRGERVLYEPWCCRECGEEIGAINLLGRRVAHDAGRIEPNADGVIVLCCGWCRARNAAEG